MNVLYANHTSTVSGAEQSLLTLLGGLPDEISAAVACPEGELASELEAAGVPVHHLAGTAGSLRLHPLHTARGSGELLRDGLELRRIARRTGADLLHANSIRAGLACSVARALGGPPVVAHVRDCLPPGRTARAIRQVICRSADAVVSNSSYTQHRFLVQGTRARAVSLHSPVDLRKFDADKVERAPARDRFELEDSDFALGVVAQITPWKGQDVAVRALHLLRDERPRARLLLAGSAKFTSRATRYDNVAYLRSLEALVAELGVADRVRFVGERDDVPELMRALDVLLMPSWEEPFGRAGAEALAMGVPVISTNVGGPSELIADGGEGRLLPPREPDAWAEAIEELAADDRLREEMGRRGRTRAESLDAGRHAEELVSVYRAVLAA